MLYVIATPIGNLGDISLRAIETLKACDFVIAENPGYSKRLLDYIDGLSVDKSSASPQSSPRQERRSWEIVQFAEHNEQQMVKNLTRKLSKQDGCLITDAGTPGISDPGFRLVRECVKENIQVIPIPGANAAIAALSASGLPTDRFIFLGFLQKTAAKTLEALQAASNAEATAIFYESPERIFKTMSYVANSFPTSQVVVARELTKMHEEFIRGSAGEVLEKLKEKTSLKGEITVIVSFKD